MDQAGAVFDFVFGCRHGHLSRVFTIGGRTYRVCCDCGRKFDYSLASMSFERHVQRRPRHQWLRFGFDRRSHEFERSC